MADDTFRTIVVGSDGSAGAAKAVAWAATLGAQTGCTVVLVHAFEPLAELEHEPGVDFATIRDKVTRPVMNERVWKKVMRQGYPDSRTVKAGLGAIRQHMDYMRSLLEHRRWLAGNVMTLADFTAAAHLSCLDYISDVDWTYSTEVQDWYAKIKSRPAFRSLLADHLPGVQPAPHYALLDF